MKRAPCPFCGSRNASAIRVSDVNGEGVNVACTDCGSEGPIEYGGNLYRDVKQKHVTAAWRRWNTRPIATARARVPGEGETGK